MKILVTSFDPFGGEDINSSMLCLQALASDNAELVKLVVPTSFERSAEAVCNAICEHRPDAVIMLGQAPRSVITVERVAVNIDDASICDNDDYKPVDKPILAGGANAYFSTLPFKNIIREVCSRGVPASMSNSAGTFVCNHLMYSVLHFLNVMMPNTLAGFIHIPPTPKQAVKMRNSASMSTADAVIAVQAAIDETVKQLGGDPYGKSET